MAPVSRRVICSTLATCSDISRACSKTLSASARRSSRAQPLPAFGEARRRARHDGQRRAQVVRYRGQQRAADALGLRFDFERRLFRGLAPHALDEPEMTSATRQHDRERQQVLDVVDGERSARRDEHEIERRDAKNRRRDRRAARKSQRDDHHREQVHHRDVDEVEARMHRQAGQRADCGGACCPAYPVQLPTRCSMPWHVTHGRRKFPVKSRERFAKCARIRSTLRSWTLPVDSPASYDGPADHPQRRQSTAALALLALGIVYGDIGTSPLYAAKETFNPQHGIPLTPENIIGGVSAIFWSLMIVVSLKYVTLVLRANNRGEGGIMALLALATAVGARAAAIARGAARHRRVRRIAVLWRRGADAGDLGALRGRRTGGRHSRFQAVRRADRDGHPHRTVRDPALRHRRRRPAVRPGMRCSGSCRLAPSASGTSRRRRPS